MKQLKTISIALTLMFLTGCAATKLALEKKDLDVQTKMSDTVFLDPVSSDKKNVYVQVRNTSDQQSLSIKNDLVNDLNLKGYQVKQNPDDAHYLLQVNLLQAGKTDPAAAKNALVSGFGGAVSGVLIAGATNNTSTQGLAAAGLLGAGIELAANALVKDVTYSLITDIQVSEKRRGNVTSKATQSLRQGNSGTTELVYENVSDRMKYQTRIVSTANQVNLDFEDAVPELKTKLVSSISGLFE